MHSNPILLTTLTVAAVTDLPQPRHTLLNNRAFIIPAAGGATSRQPQLSGSFRDLTAPLGAHHIPQPMTDPMWGKKCPKHG